MYSDKKTAEAVHGSVQRLKAFSTACRPGALSDRLRDPHSDTFKTARELAPRLRKTRTRSNPGDDD